MDIYTPFQIKQLTQQTVDKIHALSAKPITLMEVCGGHTMAIQKAGIPSLLPPHIKLISGPGCPVCVTDLEYIDRAITYARLPHIIIATFGDLMRVPGSNETLYDVKAEGADIRVVYSALEALRLARDYPLKKVIFLAIGFETTAPGTAVAIREAQLMNMDNLMVLSAHKLMPPAMEAILQEGIPIHGYLAPGHVCTITGADIFQFIPQQYHLPVVVSGFESLDILQSILLLVYQIEKGQSRLEIQYKRVVSDAGNKKAQGILNDVFEPQACWWRGLGILPKSGLKIKHAYKSFDARERLPMEIPPTQENEACICGEILKGLKTPPDCPLYKTICHPDHPIGACMVSSEGACQAHYRYNQSSCNHESQT